MAWQQLRASAALLIEWLRVFQRGGLSEASSKLGPSVKSQGGDLVTRVIQFRAAARAPTGADPPPELAPPAA